MHFFGAPRSVASRSGIAPNALCWPHACANFPAMITSLTYTHLSLFRDGMSRRTPDWVTERLQAGVGVVPVLGDKNLIRMGSAPEAVVLAGAAAKAVMNSALETVLLGTDDGTPVMACAIDAAAAEVALDLAGPGAEFADLRQVGPLLAPAEAHLLAHARGVVYWHSRHGFCGVCGAPTVSAHNGHERRCSNAACGVGHFPRTDPAVIMLVSRDDVPGGACLLGRNPRWTFPMFSTLAGFVEPGETLEQAVQREVREESGIETDNVRYMASQPWPFPASLMLGFRARATSYDISFDPDELCDCRWFSRDEVAAMKEFRDAKEDDYRLPRRDSISRWLIQTWLDGD